jgi:hypothetical protein
MSMSSLPEQIEVQSINSDAKLISDLIFVEQILTGQKMVFRDLSYYLEPGHMVRLIKLLPWQFDSQLPPA